MKKITLVIMAAGMGSRFGGQKQTADVDGRGHTLMDYSVYDAISAGFRRVIFIISPMMYPDFCHSTEQKWRGRDAEIAFVVQSITSLTDGYVIPVERQKPWGTAHATACLEGMINSPFALINADDFYGADAIHDIFVALNSDSDDCYAVGYRLDNTLSDNGSVSRGICRIEEGYLKEIREVGGIRRQGREIVSDLGSLDSTAIASMNLWGLTPPVIEECRREFSRFIKEKIFTNPLGAELFLPEIISRMIGEGRLSVRVINSGSKWLGMTYREDKATLRSALDSLVALGKYPADF